MEASPVKNRTLSMRSKLIILFSVTILVPVLIIAYVMPSYYTKLITSETEKLTESSLVGLTSNIQYYLDELERVTSIPYNYDEVMYALKLRSSGLYPKSDQYTQYKADYALYNTLPTVLENMHKEILGTLLLPFDGSVFYKDSRSTLYNARTDYDYTGQDWYIDAVKAGGKATFVKVHDQDYVKMDGLQSVFSVARLIRDMDTRKPIAVIMSDADTVVIDRIVRQLITNDSVVVLTDKNGQLVYASQQIPEETLSQLSASEVRYHNQTYVKVSKTIESSSWMVTSLIPQSRFTEKVQWMHNIGMIFAGGGLILTLFLFLAYSRKLLTPFREMIGVMRHVQRGDMSKRVDIHGKDEVAELGGALNRMIVRLDEMVISEYRAKLKQQDAEMQALQAQINPHFLYNTLNGFIGLNRKGEQQKLDRAIRSLSGLLRDILSADMSITLEAEFNIIRKYAELQSMRFGDRLTFSFSLEPSLASLRIPKLLLQPLIENSVVHGAEPCAHPCHVEINAYTRISDGRAHAVILIKDNGTGFDPKKLEHSDRVGLRNAQERLALIRDGQASLHIQSQPDQGTTITITMELEEEGIAQ